MKNILLASTALVLSAGIANAQAVTISGNGRMGVIYTQVGGGASTTVQEHRLRLQFNVAVQADHGLAFGAFSRVQLANGAPNGFAASRVWVEASGLRLTFGNQDGAIQVAGLTGARYVGYTGGNFFGGSAGMATLTQGQVSTAFTAAALTPGSNSRAALQYSFGDTVAAISHDRAGGLAPGAQSATEIGVRTRFDAFTIAAGYANRRANSTGTQYLNSTITTVSANYNGGSWQAGVIIARLGSGVGIPSYTNYALTGQADLGGGTLLGYVGRFYNNTTVGLGYNYGLGGGASLGVAIERGNGRLATELPNPVRTTTASVGVAFNF